MRIEERGYVLEVHGHPGDRFTGALRDAHGTALAEFRELDRNWYVSDRFDLEPNYLVRGSLRAEVIKIADQHEAHLEALADIEARIEPCCGFAAPNAVYRGTKEYARQHRDHHLKAFPDVPQSTVDYLEQEVARAGHPSVSDL